MYTMHICMRLYRITLRLYVCWCTCMNHWWIFVIRSRYFHRILYVRRTFYAFCFIKTFNCCSAWCLINCRLVRIEQLNWTRSWCVVCEYCCCVDNNTLARRVLQQKWFWYFHLFCQLWLWVSCVRLTERCLDNVVDGIAVNCHMIVGGTHNSQMNDTSYATVDDSYKWLFSGSGS